MSLPTVLVVDSNDETYFLVQGIVALQNVSGKVKHIYNGIDALDYFLMCEDKREFPRFIIVSLDLPDMNAVNLIDSLMRMLGFDLSKSQLILMGGDKAAAEHFSILGACVIDSKSINFDFFKSFLG